MKGNTKRSAGYYPPPRVTGEVSETREATGVRRCPGPPSRSSGRAQDRRSHVDHLRKPLSAGHSWTARPKEKGEVMTRSQSFLCVAIACFLVALFLLLIWVVPPIGEPL